MNFFKVIVSSAPDNDRLSLPRVFVNVYKKDVGKIIQLRTPNGAIFNTTILADNNELYLTNGWKSLVKCNSIGLGYFVFFKFRANLSYDIRIMDPTCTEINYRNTVKQENNVATATKEVAPRFFKLYDLFDAKDTTLRIPPKYVACHRHSITPIIHLHVPNGPFWNICIDQVDNKYYFGMGWLQFTSAYRVPPKAVLMFKYERNSNFKIRIMDKSAAEINYGLNSSTFRIGPQENHALARAQAHNTGAPSFAFRIIHSHTTKKGGVNIPTYFVRDYLIGTPKEVWLETSDGGYMRWETTCGFTHAGNPFHRRLAWYKYVLHSQLALNDACVLELIDPAIPMFRATVFRQ